MDYFGIYTCVLNFVEKYVFYSLLDGKVEDVKSK